MTTHSPPQIEPLSDISWQRIENGVFDRLDREPIASPVQAGTSRRRARVAVAAVAIAAAAAILLYFARHAGDDGQRHAAGHDDASERDDAIEREHVTQPAPAPSRIVTTDAPSHYNVADASLTIAPRSAILAATDANENVLLVLERGAVDCKVPPRRARQTFAIHAGDVRIEVIGTQFAVSRVGEDVSVEVAKGTVLVVSDGERIRVEAGQRWPAPQQTGGTAKTTQDPERAARKTAVRKPKRRPDKADKPSAKERYRAALRLQTTDPKAAAAIFSELAKRGGPWGRNALFAHAQLELERGHTASARRLLKTYLRKYPRGPNAQDARELLQP